MNLQGANRHTLTMNQDSEFLALVRSVAQRMAASGRATVTWTSDAGEQLIGWSYKQNTVVTEEIVPTSIRGYWSREWHRTVYVLATDGSIWTYQEQHEERVGSQEVIKRYLRPVSTALLVGSAGSPFSEEMAAIERLTY